MSTAFLDGGDPDDLIETRVRVLSWNLWWRFGPWEERLTRIAEVLRSIDADIVCLQEVWSVDGRDQADELADALGLHATSAPGIDLGSFVLGEPVQFGNAVLSRWPVADVERVPLTPGSEPEEARLVLRVTIDGPRGPLDVLCTHLNWRMDHSHVRQDQVRQLAQLARPGSRPYPPILAGDFNAEPHSVEMTSLTGQSTLAVPGVVFVDAWRAIHPQDPGITFDRSNRFAAQQLEWDRRLDYVLVGWPKERGAGTVLDAVLVGTEPVDGMHPSDHFGVMVDLRY